MSLKKRIALTGAVLLLTASPFFSIPPAAYAGIGTLGFLTYEGGYYIVVDSRKFTFASDTTPWPEFNTSTKLLGYSYDEYLKDGSSLPAYNFYNNLYNDASQGGHDFVNPGEADRIMSSNGANPAWVLNMLDVYHGKQQILDENGNICSSESPGNYYYANGYVMPWSGYHNAKRSQVDQGYPMNANNMGSHEFYKETVTWQTIDNRPTLSATLQDSSATTLQAGDAWKISVNFTSMEDRDRQVPSGQTSTHHYLAVLFDQSGNFVKYLNMGNTSPNFNAIGIPVKDPNASGSYVSSGPYYSTSDVPVINESSRTSGVDQLTIAAGDTASLQQGQSYKVNLFLMDDIHRYAVKSFQVTIGSPATGGSSAPGGDMSGEDLDPTASAVVRADNRDGELFDVDQGIPTSENLYVNARSKKYLYKYVYTQMKGTRTYTVTATKHWTINYTTTDDQGNTVSAPPEPYDEVHSYDIKRDYTYWVLTTLEVYDIQNATVKNYALPNGGVTLSPQGYTKPKVNATHWPSESDHVQDPTYTKDLDMGSGSYNSGSSFGTPPDSNWQAQADQDVPKIKVRNDSFTFTDGTKMDATWTDQDGPKPTGLTQADLIDRDVLYKSGNEIAPTKENRLREPSTGQVKYEVTTGSLGGSAQTFDIDGINPATIHTPVVDPSSVSDDKAHNQKTVPNTSAAAIILDEPFTIYMPSYGTHDDYPGYQTRQYRKYTKDKQVYFPFDVFIPKNGGMEFVAKNQWISIGKDADQFTFVLPVWVDEGPNKVMFREIAINAPAEDFGTQDLANYDLSNYVATRTIPVDIVGRMYDFHVTDVSDYNWQYVFRQSDGVKPTGYSYWVGTGDIDHKDRGVSKTFTLPIRTGSNPLQGHGHVAVKTGYHFKFDLKTKGNMFGMQDGIRITPTFYFVDQSGKSRQRVDLYYQTTDNRFVMIGDPNKDTEKRYVVLNTPLRDVPQQEYVDTASYVFDQYKTGYSDANSYLASYLRSAQKQNWVGSYDLMILTQPLRTFIGPKSVPAGVNRDRALASIQKWYGEYSLPAAPYVVAHGFDLPGYIQAHPGAVTDQWSDFKHDGYIIVNFNIESIQNENVTAPHLQYWNVKSPPYDDQWEMDGFNKNPSDLPTGTLQDGDVIFYDTNKSSRDDYGSGGTH